MSIQPIIKKQPDYYYFGEHAVASGATVNLQLADHFPKINMPEVCTMQFQVICKTDSEDVAGSGDLKSWLYPFYVALNTREGKSNTQVALPDDPNHPNNNPGMITITEYGLRSTVQVVPGPSVSFDQGDLVYDTDPTVTIDPSYPLTVNITCPVWVSGKGLRARIICNASC